MITPFRWLILAALGLMAGSWFLLVATCLAFVLLRWLVIPREEEALVAKFGDRYREYMQRTGRLFPRRRQPRRVALGQDTPQRDGC